MHENRDALRGIAVLVQVGRDAGDAGDLEGPCRAVAAMPRAGSSTRKGQHRSHRCRRRRGSGCLVRRPSRRSGRPGQRHRGRRGRADDDEDGAVGDHTAIAAGSARKVAGSMSTRWKLEAEQVRGLVERRVDGRGRDSCGRVISAFAGREDGEQTRLGASGSDGPGRTPSGAASTRARPRRRRAPSWRRAGKTEGSRPLVPAKAATASRATASTSGRPES